MPINKITRNPTEFSAPNNRSTKADIDKNFNILFEKINELYSLLDAETKSGLLLNNPQKNQIIVFNTNSFYTRPLTPEDFAEDFFSGIKWNTKVPFSAESLREKVVPGEKIKDNSITANKLAEDFVLPANKIKPLAISGDKLEDSCITTDKIAPQSVTGDKICQQSLKPTHLADNFVFPASAVSLQNPLYILKINNPVTINLPGTQPITNDLVFIVRLFVQTTFTTTTQDAIPQLEPLVENSDKKLFVDLFYNTTKQNQQEAFLLSRIAQQSTVSAQKIGVWYDEIFWVIPVTQQNNEFTIQKQTPNKLQELLVANESRSLATNVLGVIKLAKVAVR